MGYSKWQSSVKILECQDDFTLLEALKSLWKDKPHSSKAPMKVSVWLGDLVPHNQHNLSFLENEKALDLCKTLDKIDQKFGKGAVYFGGTHLALKAAPLRISFTNIPDSDI
jgi:DNA polymerase-4